MADIATLGVRVTATGVREVAADLGKLGTVGDATSAKLNRIALSANQYKALQQEIDKSTRLLNLMISTTNRHDTQAVAGLKTLIQEQRTWAQGVGASNEQLLRLEQTQQKFDKATSGANNSVGKLRGGLTSLLTQVAGLNPAVSQLSGLLSTFAVGSALTVGILLGLTAIAFAYQKMTEGSRAAKKASDDLVESLVKQKKAAFDASEAGARNALTLARTALATEQVRQAGDVVSSGKLGVLPRIISGVMGDRVSQEKALKDMKDAVRQAEINVQATEADTARERWANSLRHSEMVAGFAGDMKRLSDAEVEASKKALAAMQKRLDLAEKYARFAMPAVNEATDRIDKAVGARQTGWERVPSPPPSYVSDPYRAPKDPRVGPDGRTPLMRARDAQDAADAKAKENAAKASERLANTMNISSQIISASAANFLVGKLGGNTAGGNIGGSIGASVFGSLGGSVGKLLTGGYGKMAAAILGPLGQALAAGIGALVGKVVGSVFGSTSEQRAAERQARAAQLDVAATMEILRAKSLGLNTALLEQIEANRKYYEAVKLQINAALPGTKNEAERNRQRAEVDALSANEAERIRKDYERTQREKREDLEVRGLRAQGKGSEADKLALQIEHAREIMEAERSGADAAYIARLKEIQAIEKTASALNALTTSVQNAPSGFKVESYINQFAQARPWGGGGSIPGASIPYSPQLPTGMTPRSTANVFNISGPVTIDAKDKTPKQAFDEWGKVFAKEKASTVGINVSASEAFDYIF